MKFQYAPGLPGYGTQGTDGSNGLLGISLYFCYLDGDIDSLAINGKLNRNEILTDGNDKIPGYPTRLYQIGDMFVDVNGKVFKITAVSPSAAYVYTNSRLNTSTIFGETGDTDVTDPEYIRYSNGYVTDRFLIDSVFVSNAGAVGDYYASPVSGINGIYGIGAKDFAQIKYVDYDVSDYHPYLLFSNTNAPGEPERTIALVKENGKNHWRLGNLDGTGVVRDVSLSLDFADIILNGDVITNNIKSIGDVIANNIKSIGDVSINGNLYTQTVVPRTNNTYNLGSSSYKFNNGYITTLNSTTGDITTVSSTTVNTQNVIFPTGITGKIYSGGTGGNIDVSSGKGGYSPDLPGGAGGNLNLYGGQGGDGGTYSGINNGGAGGNIVLQAGSGGVGAGGGVNGSDGYVIINSDVSIRGSLDIEGNIFSDNFIHIKSVGGGSSGLIRLNGDVSVNGDVKYTPKTHIYSISSKEFINQYAVIHIPDGAIIIAMKMNNQKTSLNFQLYKQNTNSSLVTQILPAGTQNGNIITLNTPETINNNSYTYYIDAESGGVGEEIYSARIIYTMDTV